MSSISSLLNAVWKRFVKAGPGCKMLVINSLGKNCSSYKHRSRATLAAHEVAHEIQLNISLRACSRRHNFSATWCCNEETIALFLLALHQEFLNVSSRDTSNKQRSSKENRRVSWRNFRRAAQLTYTEDAREDWIADASCSCWRINHGRRREHFSGQRCRERAYLSCASWSATIFHTAMLFFCFKSF